MPVSEKVHGRVKECTRVEIQQDVVIILLVELLHLLLISCRMVSEHPDITEACCWGIVSGGFTCFYMGGTYFEENGGEKRAKIEPYYESYKKQISG